MTTEQIIHILVEEKGYDRVQTERLAPKLEALPEELRAALVQWVESGVLTSPEYHGYTVEKILQAKPGMKVVAAYLTLDWIREDPQTAIRAMAAPVMRRAPFPRQ